MTRPRRQTQISRLPGWPESPQKPSATSQDFADIVAFDAAKGEETSDSEYSDYKNKSKRRTSIRDVDDRSSKKRKIRSSKQGSRKRRPPPAKVPELSDIDETVDISQEFELFKGSDHGQQRTPRPAQACAETPKTIRLQVPAGVTTINLDLATLMQQAAGSDPLTRTNGVGVTEYPDADVVRSTHGVPQKQSEGTGFFDLEPELRNRIYRQVLVSDAPVKFIAGDGLSRTAALLRVSKQVYAEARGILYGENAFHFCRRNATRGAYFEANWKEVGYKDVRRLLETIGAHNIVLMRYLSIEFEDATSAYAAKTHDGGGRYVTDPVVHRICDLLADSNVVVDKLVVAFAGRTQLDKDDFHFLKSFTRIRCHKLINTCAFGHSKIAIGLVDKLKQKMVVKRDEDVDVAKIKTAPKMFHEQLSDRCYSHRCPMYWHR